MLAAPFVTDTTCILATATLVHLHLAAIHRLAVISGCLFRLGLRCVVHHLVLHELLLSNVEIRHT